MAEKIKAFMNVVKVWNREVFGNIQRRKDRILGRLHGIQRVLNVEVNLFLDSLRSSYGGIMKLLFLRKKLCELRNPVVDGPPKVTGIPNFFTHPLWLEEEEIGSWL